MKRLLTILALAAAAWNLNAQAVHVFESDNLHCNDTVYVWSPAQSSAKDIPTLILMHGWSGNSWDWNKHTDVQAVADRYGFRIICPDGLYDSWYVDNADPAKPQWRQFFWNEFWPEMAATYGLQADRTFITGLSMGGHGAMNIFLDHPDYFKGAGSMSGVLDLQYSGGSRSYLPSIFGATDIFDPACVAQCAVTRLDRYKEICGDDTKNKILVVTCGTEDKNFVIAAEEFCQKCRQLGIRHIEMLSPGKHRWPYWVWVLNYHLDWFTQVMEGTNIGEGDKIVR